MWLLLTDETDGTAADGGVPDASGLESVDAESSWMDDVAGAFWPSACCAASARWPYLGVMFVVSASQVQVLRCAEAERDYVPTALSDRAFVETSEFPIEPFSLHEEREVRRIT